MKLVPVYRPSPSGLGRYLQDPVRMPRPRPGAHPAPDGRTPDGRTPDSRLGVVG